MVNQKWQGQRSRRTSLSARAQIGSGRLVDVHGHEAWLAADWAFDGEQRRAQEPFVYAITMEDVFAELKLSQLLTIAMAVA